MDHTKERPSQNTAATAAAAAAAAAATAAAAEQTQRRPIRMQHHSTQVRGEDEVKGRAFLHHQLKRPHGLDISH